MSRIGVMIATPFRHFEGEEDLPEMIGKALREITLRGAPRPEKRDIANPTKNLVSVSEWERFQTGNEEADKCFRAEADKYAFEWVAAVGGLSRARNNCVDEFLKSKHSFLIWQDEDLTKPEGMTLADMWLRLLSHRQPVVGAMYCKRDKRPRWALNWLPTAELQPTADGLLQVAELAMGAKCYHRKVYSELARLFPKIEYRERETGERIFGFHQNVVLDSDLLSGDFFLDYLCRCATIPILADTKIKVRHVEPSGAVYPEGAFPPIPALDK